MALKGETMSDEYMKYVEERLSQWAEWLSHGNWYGLGYPSCSMEYRLMMEGTVVRTDYVHRPLTCNEEAEEMEALIKEMTMQNYLMGLTIRCHYLMCGGFRVKAKQLNISYTQFKFYVNVAKHWLIGRLSSRKIFKSTHAALPQIKTLL